MASDLRLHLWIPSGHLQETARDVLRSLAAVGFNDEMMSGSGKYYQSGGEFGLYTGIDEPLSRLGSKGSVLISLWKRSIRGETLSISFQAGREGAADLALLLEPGFDLLGLSTPMSSGDDDSVALEFLNWSMYLANIVRPWYGAAGKEEGLFYVYEFWPDRGFSLARLERPLLEWLTIFGPQYVQSMGAEKLLTTPAWRVDVLPYGGIAVTLTPRPDRVSKEQAVQVAQHLGLPDPIPNRETT